MSRSGSGAALVVWSVIAISCDGDLARNSAAATNVAAASCIDGSAVTITYNGNRPRLSPVELYRYGGVDSEPLGRVLDVALGADGAVYIADPVEGVIHAIATDRSVISIGRRGEGPGEFRVPSQVDVVADTLFVFDATIWRLSSFTIDGEFIDASIPPLTADIGQVPALVLAGGALYNLDFPITAQEELMAAAGSDRILRVPNSIARWDRRADSWASIRNVPSVEMLVRGGGITAAPFGRRPLWGVGEGGNRVWYADSGDVVIERLGPSGETDCRLVGDGFPGNPLTDEERRMFRDAADIDATDSARVAAARRSRRDVPLPDDKPMLRDLVVGADGGVAIALETDSLGDYLLFDAEGALRGHLAAGSRTRLVTFNDTLAVVIERDALDVESVVVLRMEGGELGQF